MTDFELISLFNEVFNTAFIVMPTMVVLLFGAYAGALIFFFHMRKDK